MSHKKSGPIGRLGSSKEVHIIGAGVSGLLMGYYLKKSGFTVTIFEQDNVGGKISTSKTPAGIAETAANAIFTNPDVMELLAELEIPYILPRASLKKKIWRGSKIRSFPLTPRELFLVLLRLFRRVPKDVPSLSVFGFFSPLLGEKAAFEVLSAVFGGIYASDAKELHFKSVFKNDVQARTYFGYLRELAKARKASGHKAESISFKGGMQTFINALSEALKDSIVLEKKTEIDPDANTIVCGDAVEAAGLLKNEGQEIRDLLKSVKYRPLSTGTYFLKRPVEELEGSFGILFAPNSGFASLGILHNSAIFEGRVEHSEEEQRSYTFIAKGDRFAEEDALDDLKKLDGRKVLEAGDLVASRQTHWKRGIPVYNRGRRLAIDKLRESVAQRGPGLVVFGNYVDGISIREMVTGAKKFANEA